MRNIILSAATRQNPLLVDRQSPLLAGCGAALCIGLFLMSLEISATAAISPAEPTGQLVNRALKSDRLPRTVPRNAVKGLSEVAMVATPMTKPELPYGCEPMVSPMMPSPLSYVAGRCVS
jgi:hypothetical protein